MITKEAVLQLIRDFPDDVTLPEIIAELHFLEKVDQSLRELDAGMGVPHDQVCGRLRKWLP